MLVDLDTPATCPPAVILDWFGTSHPRLQFRMAVMEIEAWLLADRARLAGYLGIAAARVPARPDEIADPKQLLVNLARRSSKRNIRQDLVPEEGSTASVGPAYTPRLVEFAGRLWNPLEAAASSESLARAMAALASP